MHESTGTDGAGSTPKFPLGRVLMTRGVQALVQDGRLDPRSLLQRHVVGDWGDLDEEDKRANDASVEDGSRLLSSYRIDPGLTVWVITEADRQVTTLLLPSEY